MSIPLTHTPVEPDATPAKRPIAFIGGGMGYRALILTVVVTALAIGTIAMASASFVSFSRVLMTTVDSRLLEIATEISGRVEDSLQAGVPLGQQRRLLEAMDQERTQAPDLAALRVADERGVIVFSTNRAEIGDSVRQSSVPAERPLVEADVPGVSRRTENGFITLARPMNGLFGEPIGVVLVALPTSVVTDQRQRYATSLAIGAAAFTLLGALITMVLLSFVSLPPNASIAALRTRMESLFTAAAGGTPGPPPSNRAILDDELTAFEDATTNRLERLARREETLQRLDQDA